MHRFRIINIQIVKIEIELKHTQRWNDKKTKTTTHTHNDMPYLDGNKNGDARRKKCGKL